MAETPGATGRSAWPVKAFNENRRQPATCAAGSSARACPMKRRPAWMDPSSGRSRL